MFNFLIQHSPLLYLTQSFWRDEVFSVFMSARPIGYFVSRLNFEPPFYYLLLHFWMKIFGESEIAVRSLSLTAFAMATVLLIYWSEKLFQKHWLSWWLPLFFFFNPMLLYYAMEARTYGWYIFFATLSLWAYSEKRWFWWIVATVLGFYTHSYMIIVPFAEAIHYVLVHRKQIASRITRDPMIRSIVLAGLFIVPWLVRLANEAQKLKSSWYFPVDLNLITSVLGNLFVGYEGTPWYLWTFTKWLSLGIFAASVLVLTHKSLHKKTGVFLVQIYVPLAIIIGISFLKPLYVNRYVIPATIAEVFIIAFAIHVIKHPLLQKIIAAICLLFVVGFNFWYPDKHSKLDIRSTIRMVNILKASGDVTFTDSPLIFFETIYYSNDRTHVYLYNPQSNPFPWYVGDTIVSPSQMVSDYPPYPIRAFVVHADGTFEVVYHTPVSIQAPGSAAIPKSL